MTATNVGEQLLKESLLRWENHRIMVRWLSRFFTYLDRYATTPHVLRLCPPLIVPSVPACAHQDRVQ